MLFDHVVEGRFDEISIANIPTPAPCCADARLYGRTPRGLASDQAAPAQSPPAPSIHAAPTSWSTARSPSACGRRPPTARRAVPGARQGEERIGVSLGALQVAIDQRAPQLALPGRDPPASRRHRLPSSSPSPRASSSATIRPCPAHGVGFTLTQPRTGRRIRASARPPASRSSSPPSIRPGAVLARAVAAPVDLATLPQPSLCFHCAPSR